ncbi:glycosyltransferase family 4 protein [Methanococcus voltae]|uniref:Glycosyltransferase involved in cell wall biosynthesis n=2 Tax=Methanococcus voltae TaxID=2188 RepID=A0A8J7RGP7_METVO|nr:glycosyltransferase family 4 protein [Methanococcus voltae]MBP2172531.1 glycosyltransferase involved in cell wall biosynthesis [Methanococcus voltae]MBP2201562.1 glycosyltransferase involved in cell wall biosynthesis [Methanococcus voltae]MCS3922351.1 glycosyltransferase involved in cell wall biosynthesis [Methanococcus voltae PS]
MKIAMLTWEYPPLIVGGLSIHCKNLAEALVKMGHEVDVITTGEVMYSSKPELVNGVNIYRVKPMIKEGEDFLSWSLLMASEMEKKLGDLEIDKYDLIHCHDWMTSKVGINLKYLLNKPYVQSIHSTEYGRCSGINSKISEIINEMEFLSVFEADEVITVSNASKKELCGIFSAPDNKIHTIYNGINLSEYCINQDSDELSEFRDELGIKNDDYMLLYVGRLEHQKGVNYLIRAFRILADKYKNLKLVLVGEGSQHDYLKSLSENLCCNNNMIFTGFKNGDELKKLYCCADICVVPSIYEPFGLVALESMASETPIVVSNTGGLSEIVNSKNGIKVEPKNPKKLAVAISKLLENNEFRNNIINNAKNDLLNYSWDNIAYNTSKVYKKAVKNKLDSKNDSSSEIIERI